MLNEDVVLEVDEVVVVLEVMESEQEETDVGDGGGSRLEPEVEGTDVADGKGSRTAGAGAGCWCHVWCVVVSRGVSAVLAGGLCGGGPIQLQDVWVCLLEAFEGGEEALLDAGHVLCRE